MVNVSYATVGLLDRDLDKALEAIAAAEFKCVELFGMDPHIRLLDAQCVMQVRASLQHHGLTATTMHGPFSNDVRLSMPDEPRRTQIVALIRGYLRFAGEIGVPEMVLHSGIKSAFVRSPEAPDINDRIWRAARQSLDELVPVAAQHRVRLLLENVPTPGSFPLYTLAEQRALIDDYPAAQVGLVIDVGHAWTIHVDPAAEIKSAGDRLHGTHLQDVPHDDPQDNHWLPGEGGLDWNAIRAALRDINYQGAWTFEVINGRKGETPDQLARKAFDVAQQWGLVG